MQFHEYRGRRAHEVAFYIQIFERILGHCAPSCKFKIRTDDGERRILKDSYPAHTTPFEETGAPHKTETYRFNIHSDHQKGAHDCKKRRYRTLTNMDYRRDHVYIY